MPITKQAIKKMRSDRIRTSQNTRIRKQLREVIKSARRSPSIKTLSTAYKNLDKSAKRRVIHKNRAARLKSRLGQLLRKK